MIEDDFAETCAKNYRSWQWPDNRSHKDGEGGPPLPKF